MGKNDDSEKLASAFLRQRRNLMLGCLALLFIQFGNVAFDGITAWSGFAMHVRNPTAVLIFLWIAVCYWTLRFLQYHLAIRPTGFQGDFREAMNEALRAKAIEILKKHAPTTLPAAPHQLEPDETSKLVADRFVIMDRHLLNADGEVTLVWEEWQNGKLVQRHPGKPIGVPIRGWVLHRSRIVALLHMIFRTHQFTEYGLPYVLFAATVLVHFLYRPVGGA